MEEKGEGMLAIHKKAPKIILGIVQVADNIVTQTGKLFHKVLIT